MENEFSGFERRLDELNERLDRLKPLRERERAEFDADPYPRDVAERNLEISAQCCIDICHRMFSRKMSRSCLVRGFQVDRHFDNAFQPATQFMFDDRREVVSIRNRGIRGNDAFQGDEIILIGSMVSPDDNIVGIIQRRDPGHNLGDFLAHPLLQFEWSPIPLLYLLVGHLDMSVNLLNFRQARPDLFFKVIHDGMSFAQGQAWVDSDVNFNIQFALEALHP